LRQAVVAYFNDELHRFGGRAELVFDRTSEQVLDLSGPTYSFKVRRRGGPPLGLVPLEVDVRTDGRAVQTVPLVVQVSMVRPVVTAARAINQEATVGSADVRVVPLAFNRTDKLGVSDPGQIVGQRARRFIPAGSILEPGLLESVPLVVRGQLVTLITQVGPVRVVTSGKAADTGTFGDVVRVRSVDDRRTEFNGVVVGPAKVEVGVHRGTYSEAQADPQLAMTRGVPR
jgi:flagella basal body P-ring formation protein FlgA